MSLLASMRVTDGERMTTTPDTTRKLLQRIEAGQIEAAHLQNMLGHGAYSRPENHAIIFEISTCRKPRNSEV